MKLPVDLRKKKITVHNNHQNSESIGNDTPADNSGETKKSYFLEILPKK
jgi:hypothetical protein